MYLDTHAGVHHRNESCPHFRRQGKGTDSEGRDMSSPLQRIGAVDHVTGIAEGGCHAEPCGRGAAGAE